MLEVIGIYIKEGKFRKFRKLYDVLPLVPITAILQDNNNSFSKCAWKQASIQVMQLGWKTYC